MPGALTWRHVPELSGSLKAHHFPPESVVVEWEDGSRVEWKSAFWRKEGVFYVVYTEHCGYHVLWLHREEDGDRITGREGPIGETPLSLE